MATFDWCNVLDYGAVGDGNNDDTAAFQLAVNDAILKGKPLYVAAPPVAYKLVGTVSVIGQPFVWIQQEGAEIRDYNTVGPCIAFAGGGLITGTATSTGTTTTLNDTSKTWVSGALVSQQVRITSGTNAGSVAVITSNIGQQITFAPAMASNTDITSTYVITNWLAGITTGAGSATQLDDGSQGVGWTTNALKGRWVTVAQGGLDSGDTATASGNTSGASAYISLSPGFGSAPGSLNLYYVSSTVVGPSTGATGGSATTLQDTAQSWVPNSLVNRTLQITLGTTKYERVVVTANTPTELTFSPALADGAFVTMGDQYSLPGQLTGVWVRGLRVSNFFNTHRIPSVQFGDLNGISDVFVEGLHYDGRLLLGDATTWLNAFQVVFKDSAIKGMSGGVGVVVHSNVTNTGNIEFANITIEYMGCGFLINDAGVGSSPPGLLLQNLLNNVHFNNCKMVDDQLQNQYFQGTVGGSGAAASATTVPVGTGQGASFAAAAQLSSGHPNPWVVISSQGDGNTYFANLWLAKLQSVDTVHDTITLTEPLPVGVYGPSSPGGVADFVVCSNFGVVCGNNTSAFALTVPHFEGCLGVVGQGADDIDINQPMMGNGCFRGGLLLRGCQDWIIRRPYAAERSGSGTVVMDQLGDLQNKRNSVRGVASLSAMSSPATPLNWASGGGTNLATVTERFGGTQTLLGIWYQQGTIPSGQAYTLLTGPSNQRPVWVTSPGGAMLTRLVVVMTYACTAGSLTASVFMNGTVTTLSAKIQSAGPTYYATVEAFVDGEGLYVPPGSFIDVRVMTSAIWAPTANDVDVQVWGEF